MDLWLKDTLILFYVDWFTTEIYIKFTLIPFYNTHRTVSSNEPEIKLILNQRLRRTIVFPQPRGPTISSELLSPVETEREIRSVNCLENTKCQSSRTRRSRPCSNRNHRKWPRGIWTAGTEVTSLNPIRDRQGTTAQARARNYSLSAKCKDTNKSTPSQDSKKGKKIP